MKALVHWGMPLAAAASLIFTSGCGPVSGFSVGGRVADLSGNLGLSLNGTEALSVTRNGIYTFTTRLATGATYDVTVASHPNGQHCTVNNGSGVVAAVNITNVQITCVVTAPVVTHIWPANLLGGSEVKISGSNLEFASIAYNGEAMAPTLQTPNELRFIAPEIPKGIYALELENADGFVSRNVIQGEVMGGVVSLDSAEKHNCAALSNGTVQCWGSNGYGQIGNGSINGYQETLETVVGINNALSVSTGDTHSCAVLSTGAVKCWGDARNGRLGNGNSEGTSASPATVTGIGNAVSVSAGNAHSCAVLSTGEVQCWGWNGAGQLGNSDAPTSSAVPVAVTGISNALSVSGGANSSCAVLSSGEVRCWGAAGQLGDGSTTTSAIPVTVAGISNALSVSVGNGSSCAVLSTGAVKCWGYNGYGQLGDDSTTQRTTPVTVYGINNAVSVNVSSTRVHNSYIANGIHSCAVLATGEVQCWGANESGQLGNGSTQNSSIPVAVTGLNDALSVSAGGGHSCAVLRTGSAQCWGWNENGQLGYEIAPMSTVPVTVTGFGNALSVSVSEFYSCAVMATGKVQCLGRNDNGQLGNGGTKGSPIPVEATGIGNAVSVSVSKGHDGWLLTGSHSCALLSTGKVQCWGANWYGQLGNGSSPTGTTPVTVAGINDALSVSAGVGHSCAVQGNGAVQCWGANDNGQLGNGNTTNSSTPVTVTGITNALSVSAGAFHSCALLRTGKVQCWGSNGYGQLGNGSAASTTPVTVAGISNAQSLSTGLAHNCALLSTGSVRCWGFGINGQLGNGSIENRSTAVAVSGITSAVSISTGNLHSCAVLSSGTVRCWGWDERGELGDGDEGFIQSLVPTTVAGINNALSVSVGGSTSCALLRTGATQCWGYNDYGQLSLPARLVYQLPWIPVFEI